MPWSIQELIGDVEEQERLAIEKYMDNMRVALPGLIHDFDPLRQTATVKPAIKEQIKGEWLALPLLPDVPVQFPKAGGFSITFPVRNGDECLIVFNDMCIDSWWQSGDIQTQLEKRRHDLSDAVAILGITSVPKAINNFSVNSMQIRNVAGDTVIDIIDGRIALTARQIDVNCENINVKASSGASIKSPNILLDGEVRVTGDVIGDQDVIASQVSLVTHTHISGAEGEPTSQPNRTGLLQALYMASVKGCY